MGNRTPSQTQASVQSAAEAAAADRRTTETANQYDTSKVQRGR